MRRPAAARTEARQGEAMTNAEKMAVAARNGDQTAFGDLQSDVVNVIYVMGDGSVFEANDQCAVTLTVKYGRVREVVFRA